MEDIKKRLLPWLQQAETLRKKHRFYKTGGNLFILTLVLGIFFLPMITYMNNSGFTKWVFTVFQDSSEITFQILLILYWALYFIFYIKANRLNIKYIEIEKEILKPVLNSIIPGFKFNPQRQITPKEINESELIPIYSQVPHQKRKQQKVYNMNFGIVSGRIGNISATMGDVKIINQGFFGSYFMHIPFLSHLYFAYTYLRPFFSKNHSINQVGYSFFGMFAIVDFSKKLNGSTVVLPDKLEKRIGYLAKTVQSLKLNRKQLVNLEHTEFESEFVVYGTDQIEARYILSTSLMERIMALKRKMERPIMLSFKNEKLYMAIQHPDGFFSLPQNKNLVTSDAFELFVENISNAIGIVEDLDLNTKIWKA